MNRFRFLSAILTVLVFAGGARAQSNEGRILGTIRDSSGGVVIGAAVTITNTATHVSRALVSNSVGDYHLPIVESRTLHGRGGGHWVQENREFRSPSRSGKGCASRFVLQKTAR